MKPVPPRIRIFFFGGGTGLGSGLGFSELGPEHAAAASPSADQRVKSRRVMAIAATLAPSPAAATEANRRGRSPSQGVARSREAGVTSVVRATPRRYRTRMRLALITIAALSGCTIGGRLTGGVLAGD